MSRDGGRVKQTIVLIDDHPLVLDAAASVFASHGFDVIGTATSGRGGLEILGETPADIVVIDLKLPGEDTPAVLREIRSRWPDTVVVVLSGSDDEGHIGQALASGAHAYIVKSTDLDDLVAAVRHALRPSIYFSRTPATQPRETEPDGSLDLTRRELEILRLVAEGRSNAEIARTVWVTQQTVKFHLSNIYRKLGVSNRTEASRYAQLHGLGI
jgi:DNA-binding NarL/FixJ family response regulator